MRQLAVLAAIIAAIAVLNATPANAQANRTFVSGRGLDSNPCTNTQPCRSFAAAVLVTNAGGEVVAQDPAGYGPVTITKSLSLINNAVGEAGITQAISGAAAITISAGASGVVTLRGLTLNGTGNGSSAQGILVTGVGTLNIQNCLIRDFGANGIVYQPTTTSTLTVFNTTVLNIGGSTAAVLLDPSGTSLTVNAYLSGVQVIGNAQHGIDANTQGMTGGSLQVTVVDSVLSGNSNGAGLLAPTLSAPTMVVINTKMTDNDIGLNVGGGTAYIAETTIAGNSTNGFLQRPGATIASFGNNNISDTNNSGSLSALATQ